MYLLGTAIGYIILHPPIISAGCGPALARPIFRPFAIHTLGTAALRQNIRPLPNFRAGHATATVCRGFPSVVVIRAGESGPLSGVGWPEPGISMVEPESEMLVTCSTDSL